MDPYDAVTTQAGRYVQGGGCATVGVAGLIQSGGFGSFSKNYGTAAAGLLEAEIVTADGSLWIANGCTNSDLFWGIKGGGGGSLGVVTKVTLRTRELPDFFGGVFATVKAASDAAFRRLISQFISFYGNSLLNPHWGESVTFRPDNTLAITMLSHGLDKLQGQRMPVTLRGLWMNCGRWSRTQGLMYPKATWQQSFWGQNYPRLRTVKAKYDPAGLFFFHHGVGSEEWSADGFERPTKAE